MTYREAIGHALNKKIGNNRITGAPIYAVYGAEGDGDGSTDDSAGDDDDDASGDDDDDSGDDSGGSDDDDPEVKKASDKAKERMKAADRRAAAAEKALRDVQARLKELDDKDKSELERAQARVAELEKEKADNEAEIKKSRLQAAFLSVNDITWHDPEDALGAIDLSTVDIDDAGKVNKTQLEKAIKALAAKKPHWVKSEDSSSGASGSAMNGRRKGSDTQAADREALEKRLPALRNR